MSISVGLIAYNCPHLKTEQIVHKLLKQEEISEINIYALPFVKRKDRKILFHHRPSQHDAIDISDFAIQHKINFNLWDGQSFLPKNDYFLITGASIIDPTWAAGVPIINGHPGIIPASRGLDSFKWSIYYGIELGITLHFIDKEVDKGEIITIEKTPIYKSDTIETLARRHYELEMDIMGDFLYHLDHRQVPSYCENDAKMRMPYDVEVEMLEKFNSYKKDFT